MVEVFSLGDQSKGATVLLDYKDILVIKVYKVFLVYKDIETISVYKV